MRDHEGSLQIMLSRRFKAVLVLVLSPALVYLAALNLADRADWRTPSDGIGWSQNEDGLVVATIPEELSGAMVQAGDRLVDINGLRVRSIDDYTEILEVLSETKSEIRVADYTFRRAGSDEELTVPVQIREKGQFGSVDIPLVAVALTFLVAGVLTYLRNSQAPGAFHFTLVCLVAFILLVFRYSGRADGFDVGIYWLSGVAFLLLPPLFFHFCLRFPTLEAAIPARSTAAAIWYFPALLLGLVHLSWFLGKLDAYGLGRTPRAGEFLDRVELAHFLVFFLLSGAALLAAWKHAVKPDTRKQLQWILAGMSLGLAPFTLLYALPFVLGLSIAEWTGASVLSLALIPVSFAYAISKFRLKDVDLIFKRGVAYVTASSAVLAFYVAIALLIGQAFRGFSDESGFLLLAVSALVVAVLFAPLRDRIQELLDRYFYKERYDYRLSFLDFSHTLGSEIQLDSLLEKIAQRLHQTLEVAPVGVFLRDDSQPARFYPEKCLGASTLDLPSEVSVPQFDLGLKDGLAEGDTWQFDLLRDQLGRWGFRYFEKLQVRGKLIGFLALGAHRNGDMLNSEEREMTSSLARYASIAIDNALLYRSLESKARELLELQVYSESVVESIRLGVAVVTAEGRVTVWNSAMIRMTGVDRSDAIGRSIAEVLPKGLTEPISQVLDGPGWMVKETSQVFKASVDDAGGQTHLFNAILSPFISQENVNTGTLVVLDDITERVRLESQLQQAERLSSIGVFAAGIAHEVNTPLAGISSYAQMLLEECPAGDPGRELLEKISKQSFRASEILNNLLKFARFSDRDFEEVNVNGLVVDSVSLLQHQFRKGSIEVDVELDPTLPRTVGNGGKLQQVFMNLLLNARDSMPNGGRLKLTSTCRNSELLIQVQDSGSGISSDNIRKIYDPFFTTKAPGKGTGLGLSITYGIVQEHAGRILVESQPGKGTTFSVYLPLKRVQ